MFDLATNSKNLTLNLNDIPDQYLEMMVEWNNERIEEHNRQMPH